MSTRAMIPAVVLALLAIGTAMANSHAPWPTDWNNWEDPALWVTVGNPGNAGEWSGESYGGYGPDRICGAVDYEYNIGKFEVTAGQYTAFLNAVAKTDTYSLYSMTMDETFSGWGCGIRRNGSPGSYSYTVASDWANRPVNFITWVNAARFANWLSNGQKSGGQDLTTTEDGSYYITGALITRKPNARYVIPNEDEWYKAAFYDPDKPGGPGYWDYATGTDSVPGQDPTEGTQPGNNANYYSNPGNTFVIGYPYYRTVAGDFSLSESPYGTFDQSGNLWEWNEGVIESGRGRRGGSYLHNGASFMLAANRDASYDFPSGAGLGNGFRIVELPAVAVPEPLSVVSGLIGLGMIGVHAWRREHLAG